MSAFHTVTRIGGGGYFTDVDPWGRTIASNLPPTHVLHHELERLNHNVQTLEKERIKELENVMRLEVDKEELLENTKLLKSKVLELRTKLRTEVPAKNSNHTTLYQIIDTAISTADANILRAVLREVCRESEKAATIAASILSPAAEPSKTPKAPSTTSTGTTSTRRTSVRFQEPPISSTSHAPSSTRRTSARFQKTTSAEYNGEEHIRRKKREHTSGTERHSETPKAEFTTPRRSKRRAAEDEAEELGSRKRRSTAPLICTNCNKEYNASENMRGVCRKHSGMILPTETDSMGIY